MLTVIENLNFSIFLISLFIITILSVFLSLYASVRTLTVGQGILYFQSFYL